MRFKYLVVHIYHLSTWSRICQTSPLQELNISDPQTARVLQNQTLELLRPDRHENSPTLGKQISGHRPGQLRPPDYVHPSSRRLLLFSAEIPLVSITFCVVVARMYARVVLAKRWKVGLDDWLMCFAMICAIGLTVIQCISCNYGWGLHVLDILPWWISSVRQLAFATQITFITCVSMTKLSILVFYLRISVSSTFRTFVFLGMLYTVGFWFSFLVTILVQCEPLRAFWDLGVPHNCINEPAANTANAVLNFVGDIYVFVLPLKTVWELRNVPKIRKIGLIFVLGLGVAVCAAGCLRVWYLERIIERSDDSTWTGVILYILTAIECDFAIICGCLPALKQIYKCVKGTCTS